MATAQRTSRFRLGWAIVAPLLAIGGLGLTLALGQPTWLLVLTIPLMLASVLAAVEHAEAIGHRLGEPFGSIVLALAVTVIEVGLIVSIMGGGAGDADTLARDTVFAAVMLCSNGIVGLSLLVGALGAGKDGITEFNAEGCRAELATLVTLVTLCLVIPSFTETVPGPELSAFQLAFVSLAALGLWALFVATQTYRHRGFFLDVDEHAADDLHEHPGARSMPASLVMLFVALVGVIGLAKLQSKLIERGVEAAGLPHAVVGVSIAIVVLLPETVTAVRAARRGAQQTALNLAYGSAIATTGLTIPVLAALSPWLAAGLHLGLDPQYIVLFVLTVLISILTVTPGRATRLQGGVHLAVLMAWFALVVSP
jgi:Ca2+:H+ antiporter